MSLTNAYATVAQLREQFDDGGTALPVALLERALNATSRGIEDFCGRRFWLDPVVQTLTFDVEWPDLLLLEGLDEIGSTTGLIVKTDTSGNGTYATTLTLGTDFRLGPKDAAAHGPAYAWRRLEILKKTTTHWFMVGEDNVQVTARFGWTLVPDGVEQACILRAAQIFKRRESISGVAGFDGFGVVRISRSRDPDVAELLEPHIKTTVGAV